MSGPDHKASMELRDFYSFVYKLKNIDVTLRRKHEKKCQKEEFQSKKISRKVYIFKKFNKRPQT